MTGVLTSAWAEKVCRVRLGIEPLDALGLYGPLGGIGAHVEDVPRPWPVQLGNGAPAPFGDQTDGAGLPALPRSWSGRFAVVFDRPAAGGGDHVTVRLVSPDRRYVPRRLAIPAPTLAAVTAAEEARAVDPARPLVPRKFRPHMYPGAAYGVAAGSAVIRGRVGWQGTARPVRWARVLARSAAPVHVFDEGGEPVETHPELGRAHGDDRGEFLLALRSLPRQLFVSPQPDLDLQLVVEAAPEPAPTDPADSPTRSRTDPLWDLPVETAASLDSGDDVTRGTATPAGFTCTRTVVLTVRRADTSRPAIAISLQP